MFVTCKDCPSAYDCTSNDMCSRELNDSFNIELIAAAIWKATYPERRPWNELEQSTREEWIRFATNARRIILQL